MPLTEFSYFTSSDDLHVLRTQPAIRLSEMVNVEWGTTPGVFESGTLAAYFNLPTHPQDVGVEFRPLFQFSDTGTALGNDDFGISLEKNTGLLTLAHDAPPDPWPHNFIVEAVVTRNDLGPVPEGFKPLLLRVHVHQSVVRIWATPNTLSVRRATAAGDNPTLFRFTVRAEFDDETAADITNSGRYAPVPADAECFDPANLNIIVPASLAAGQAPRTITFVTTAEWNSQTCEAHLQALPPLDTDPDLPPAELISGHPRVIDGTLPPEKVPNLVFIASGFTAADQPAFETMTNTLVHRLRTDPQLRPYPYMAPAMNFWRIPIVAPEGGVSVRMEVYSFQKDSDLFALPVPKPEVPPATGTWKLRHLLYAVGLPMPHEGVGQVTIAKLRDRWALTARPGLVPMLQNAGIVRDMTIDAWQRCASRTFIDEVNNFPSISVGNIPAVDAFAEDVGLFNFHSLRSGAMDPDTGQDLDRRSFFQRVAAKPKNGNTLVLASAPNNIGHLWAGPRDGFAFDNQVFVIDLCNMPTGHVRFGRAGWAGIFGLTMRPTLRLPTEIALVTNETTHPGLAVVKDPIRKALKLHLPPLDAMELLPQAWQTIAHEVGHAFGLGDEYATRGATLAPDDDFNSVTGKSNLMFSGEVLKPDGIAVDVSKIKWNWHRIRAASLITGPINPLGNEKYEVPMAPRSGLRFKPGNAVFFRQRSHEKNFPIDLQTSEECKIDSVNQDGSMVTVSRAAGALDLPHVFLPESILYAPVVAPPGIAPPRPYLTLVSPLAERLMAATGGTMIGKVCNLTDEAVYRAPVQSPVLPTGELDKYGPINARPRIVGVYYGGGEFSCGVVHPAGSCQMRNGFDAYTHFCHVCQYTLVDKVDPEQHGLVDRDHDKLYTL